MESLLTAPANVAIFGIPAWLISVLITLLGLGAFAYIVARRLIPLAKAAPDPRLNRGKERLKAVLKFWLAQYKQPRYMFAGVLHILIFAGFIILSIRSISLVIIGFNPDFVFPGLGGFLGDVYHVLKDYAATIVLIASIVAIVRRLAFLPDRYRVPAKYGKEHTAEAVLVLALIGSLMFFESLFDATAIAAAWGQGHAEFVAPGTLAWFFSQILSGSSTGALQPMHTFSYFAHDLIFFFFLCFLPFGKHFHVLTSIFNVFFMKLDRGTVKPVKWGVSEEELDDLQSFGVKYFEDFTWKHILDFYTCVDCGRCSDNCPANTVGRPLSPRFISIKSRDYAFERFPVRGDIQPREPVMGRIFEEDEIWSCTTCGACEEECPVLNEYIDKIVDLRRAMVDEGLVPQSLQKPLKSLEKRGNPYGMMEKKKSAWTQELAEEFQVKVLDKKQSAQTLYFVDSACSFDERLMQIARSTARIMQAAGADFGILGKAEKDSGHEVRRFGEEMLFQELKNHNTQAITGSGAREIVTADPHALNALLKDYQDLPQAEHISQFILKSLQSGRLQLEPLQEQDLVFTYHDPCYLGRHNLLFDPPRQVLDSIPGLKRVEMQRSRDSSFCCGGGGLMLYYEPVEEKRMGQVRVEMADQAGANVIITGCPFCLINLEDGVKTSGLEGKIQVMDLTELVAGQLKKD
ncbi:MAG: heterodisulfide reductase-related iron-sulfur binding cluster [Thermodesulfobacteriota bacterium]